MVSEYVLVASALGSCVAAIFTWRATQQLAGIAERQLADSVRPALVYEDWQAESGPMGTTVTGGCLHNIGKGAAYDIEHFITDTDGKENASMTLNIPGISILPQSIKSSQGLSIYLPRTDDKRNYARGDCLLICSYKDEFGNGFELTTHLITGSAEDPENIAIQKLCDNLFLQKKSLSRFKTFKKSNEPFVSGTKPV